MGPLLILLSAASFGAMGILGKLAYQEGSTVGTLLTTRFVVAAIALWILAAATGALRSLSRRDILLAGGLGAIGYGAQSTFYSLALERLDASLLSLIMYTFPAIVCVAAVLLGREQASLRTAGAVILASLGIALVVTGASTGSLDSIGVAFATACAVAYSIYILTSQGLAQRVPALELAAIICTGAAISVTATSIATGDLRPEAVSLAGYGWLFGLAAIPTVAAIVLFFAGLARVGPTAAAILSTLEPVVTFALAAAIFGEVLGPWQLLGGALVLCAAVIVGLARTRPLPEPSAAAA